MDVIARACQAVCAAGGQALDMYRRASPCAGCAHRGTGWVWRDMQMNVSCSRSFGRPKYWLLYLNQHCVAPVGPLDHELYI